MALTIAVVCLLVGVRVVAVSIALSGHATAGPRTVLPGDVRRYHRIATLPGVPYRDHAVEYPPLTLAAIEVLDGGTVRQTTVRVMWSQLVLDLSIAAILAWAWGRCAALVYLVLGLAFVWYPFLYLRLDLLSVVLAVAGLALLRKRAALLGGAWLGVAAFAKIWPLALVPALLARRAWRAVAGLSAVALLGLGGWIAWSGIDGPIQVVTFRGARGWQAESLVGAVVHFLHGGQALIEAGAARVGVVPGWATPALFLAALLIVSTIAILARRVPVDDVRVHDGLVPLATITTMLVAATILSPQYVSWLLPFAAIAAAHRVRFVGALTFVVAASSTLGLNLVNELNAGDAAPMVIVLVRNALLVVLLVVSIRQIVTAVPSLDRARVRATRRQAIGVPELPSQTRPIAAPMPPTAGVRAEAQPALARVHAGWEPIRQDPRRSRESES